LEPDFGTDGGRRLKLLAGKIEPLAVAVE